ncbi:MAG: hypothetical protein HC875_20535 [Anaerolineales bacterium]|nr:hypothetical protein [Anaerolineales bacterium]
MKLIRFERQILKTKMKNKNKKITQADKSLQELKRPLSIEDLFSRIDKIYFDGISLKKTALKNYSGKALVSIAQNIVSFCGEEIFMKNDEYFDFHDDEDNISGEQERLDISARINNQIKILIECRAWMDKPFLLLKMMVILRLLYGKCVPKDTLFIIICYSADYNKFIFQSCMKMLEVFLGYPLKIEIIPLSNKRRPDAKKFPDQNWFTNGYEKDSISQIISLIKKGIL